MKPSLSQGAASGLAFLLMSSAAIMQELGPRFMAGSGNAEAAKALIAFMGAPGGPTVVRAQRMDPANP